MLNFRNFVTVKFVLALVAVAMCCTSVAHAGRHGFNPLGLESHIEPDTDEAEEFAFRPMILDVKEKRVNYFQGYTFEEVKLFVMGAVGGIVAWEILRFVRNNMTLSGVTLAFIAAGVGFGCRDGIVEVWDATVGKKKK